MVSGDISGDIGSECALGRCKGEDVEVLGGGVRERSSSEFGVIGCGGNGFGEYGARGERERSVVGVVMGVVIGVVIGGVIESSLTDIGIGMFSGGVIGAAAGMAAAAGGNV